MNIAEHLPQPGDQLLTRRQLLARLGLGLGAIGAGTLLAETGAAAAEPHPAATASLAPLAPRSPHFPGRVSRVIHIFAQGAPSQIDTWDPKPGLSRWDGQTLPELNGVAMASPFRFSKHGRAGIEVSEVFPQLADHVDEMAIIRSMWTDVPAHDVATVFMNTGSLRLVRPSVGAWTVYGLGTENQNMPGFISLRSGTMPPGGAQNWQAAFLPGVYQGTSVNVQGQSTRQLIPNIRNPYSSVAEQRRQLDYVQRLNEMFAPDRRGESELEARLQAFEIAFKMQAAATDAFDVNGEPARMREAYGNNVHGRQLLVARRLLERGVRFVQVWAGGWDHHQDLEERLPERARDIDQPLAALLTDLRERGLLESTLVIWGGEFGRKPTKDRNAGDSPGRDHNSKGFCTWMAGGGIRGGTVYGATDEFGHAAVQDKVHVHDLHATVLHLLGLDHTRLVYRHSGRAYRLTDNAGTVVKGILA